MPVRRLAPVVAELTVEPLQTTDAHSYWQVFLAGRSDVPSRSLQDHVARYLALPPEEQRSHFAIRKDSRIIGTVRLLPASITGFSMEPSHSEDAVPAILRAIDIHRAAGAMTIDASFEDRYEPAFSALGFRRVFARMRMEAATRKERIPDGLRLQPPEEAEVPPLTKFLMDVYEGHMEQAFGLHVGSEAEWRGYVAGLFKGDSGQYLPDASFVCLESGRLIGAILTTHWMGGPLVAELGVAKDRRGRGLGRALLLSAMNRLVDRGETKLALYVTVGNEPAIALYRRLGFGPVGGQSVTARLEAADSQP